MRKCLAAFFLATMLPACDSNSTAINSANSEPSTTPSNISSTPVEVESPVSLSDAAINFDSALGRVPAIVSAPGPCPFLSDDTVKSAAKTNYELERREVSNSECRWSYNAGFAITVTVEATNKSIPIAERRYNLDVDTELEPQTGPGENAALVSDTAWGKPMPFGYGFELNDDAIFIRVTGMHTDKKRLRATAEEIAKLLPDAPSIEPQRRTESVTFEPCSVWRDQAVQNTLGLTKDNPFSSHASGNSCVFKAYGDGNGNATTLTVRFGELDPKYHTKAIEKGDEDVKGFDFPVSASTEESSFGTYTKITAYVDGGAIEIFVLDEANIEHKDVTKRLLENLAARIKI
ncbi:MAG: hypothetical protein ACI9JM_001116 [Halioglobus sp.]|jgi:hypothetical protein